MPFNGRKTHQFTVCRWIELFATFRCCQTNFPKIHSFVGRCRVYIQFSRDCCWTHIRGAHWCGATTNIWITAVAYPRIFVCKSSFPQCTFVCSCFVDFFTVVLVKEKKIEWRVSVMVLFHIVHTTFLSASCLYLFRVFLAKSEMDLVLCWGHLNKDYFEFRIFCQRIGNAWPQMETTEFNRQIQTIQKSINSSIVTDIWHTRTQERMSLLVWWYHH